MPAEGNVGIAFALVIGAGLSTTLGACAAFWAKLASPRTLAVGLGVSAGVMIYVSFVEIFTQKGVAALQDGGWGEDGSYRWGTMLFFGGMFITGLLDLAVHRLSSLAGLSAGKNAANLTEVQKDTMNPSLDGKQKDLEAGGDIASDTSEPGNAAPTPGEDVHLANRPQEISPEAGAVIDQYVTNDHHKFGLQKMGLMTAFAIGVHNLPEGLATFVAALSDPLNGLAIAVAIALHNIPEGVCVAMPVYYATGSRWKGFMWAFISGLSEPIGGLLGFLVLYGNRMSDLAYGILFCIVGGMMTYISVKELIPTAIKYDPDNTVTSTSVIFGMIVMAASLLLFTI